MRTFEISVFILETGIFNFYKFLIYIFIFSVFFREYGKRISATEYFISTLDFAYNHLSSQTLLLANMPLVTVSNDKDKFIASLRRRAKSHNYLLEKKKPTPPVKGVESKENPQKRKKRSKSTPVRKGNKKKIDLKVKSTANKITVDTSYLESSTSDHLSTKYVFCIVS